jgi:phenylacetic acid degradation operon negative regulatory protein
MMAATLELYLGYGKRDWIWMSTAIAAVTAFGIDEAAARQALNRAQRGGTILGEKVGRRVRWRWTEEAARAFQLARRRDERQRAYLEDWDGRWSLIAFETPPAAARLPVDQRPDVRLQMLGYGRLQDGLWLHPQVASQRLALEELSEARVNGTPMALVASGSELGTTDDELVRRGWDLADLDRAYRDFLSRFGSQPKRRYTRQWHDDEQSFVFFVHLLLEWPYLMMRDPILPRELLPLDWHGQDAIKLHATLSASWEPRALRWLEQLGVPQ